MGNKRRPEEQKDLRSEHWESLGESEGEYLAKLVLIGGGGHCKSVLDAALSMKRFEEIVITDAAPLEDLPVLGCRIVGNDSKLPELIKQGFEYAFITVGSIQNAWLRIKLAERAKDLGFHFPVIIDPSARISDYANIGEGTFIGKNAVLNAEVQVGRHCIINTGAILEHESSVGDYSHVSVGAIVCGDSHIGNGSFIGAGTTIIQGLRVGNKAIIGANSTVLTDVEDNMKYYGIVTKRGGV